jgi:hypothetical protein
MAGKNRKGVLAISSILGTGALGIILLVCGAGFEDKR